jgi:hypothetical protein
MYGWFRVPAKEVLQVPGHKIEQADFVRPARSMSQIGG